MLERLLLVVAIAFALVMVYHITRRLSLWRKSRHALELDQYQVGRPAILYFTTPGCAPCKTIQRPALEQIADLLGEKIQIIEINALVETQLADKWGVLSVPTTFIIDDQGRPRGVNHGIAKAEKLIHQLFEVSSGALHPDNTANYAVSEFVGRTATD
jgi:thiol-disulfide isomerase/thioredoxin